METWLSPGTPRWHAEPPVDRIREHGSPSRAQRVEQTTPNEQAPERTFEKAVTVVVEDVEVPLVTVPTPHTIQA
jgi:hypothetical protein